MTVLGRETTGTTVGLSVGYIYASGPFVATSSGTVDSLSLYFIDPVGTEKLVVGLYNDSSGVPGTKVGESAEITLSSGEGWKTGSAVGSFSVVNGQSYWLVYWVDTAVSATRGVSRTSLLTGLKLYYKSGQTYGTTLPSTFPGSPSVLNKYCDTVKLDYTEVGGGATTYTFTGPTSGVLDVASTDFTVTPNAAYTGTITPATDGTGTFAPTSLSWTATSESQTFTYTPTTVAGSPHTISVTSDPALINPASIDYAVTDEPLLPGTLSITSVTDGAVALSVTAATSGTPPYTYQFHKGSTPDFTPDAGTAIGPDSATRTYSNTGLTNGTVYYYKCVITDAVATTLTSNMIPGVPAVRQGWLFMTDSFGDYVWNGAATEVNDFALGRQMEDAFNAAQFDNTTVHDVSNRSTSSASTSDFVASLLASAMSAAPAATYPYVIILLGLNDAYDGNTKTIYKSNLQSMITTLRANSYTKIFLCYPQLVWWGTIESEAEQARLAAYCDAIDELVVDNTNTYAIKALFGHTPNNTADYGIADDNIHALEQGGINLASALTAEILDALEPADTSDLDAAAIRAAIGMASANLDIQLAALASDVYDAEHDFSRGDTVDEHRATWFKNGVRQTTVTSPTIQILDNNGVEVLAATPMTDLGNGDLRYDASGAARITAGESYKIVLVATIDAVSRTWVRLVSRDASAELSDSDIQEIASAIGATVIIGASSVNLESIDTLGNITIHRGDTFSVAITDLSDLSSYNKVYFTVKRKYDDADADAIIILEATEGLMVLNGVAIAGTGTYSGCDLAVLAGTGGDITITLSAEVTAELEANETWVYDIQMIETDGSVHTLGYGKVTVNRDVTQAIT